MQFTYGYSIFILRLNKCKFPFRFKCNAKYQHRSYSGLIKQPFKNSTAPLAKNSKYRFEGIRHNVVSSLKIPIRVQLKIFIQF